MCVPSADAPKDDNPTIKIKNHALKVDRFVHFRAYSNFAFIFRGDFKNFFYYYKWLHQT